MAPDDVRERPGLFMYLINYYLGNTVTSLKSICELFIFILTAAVGEM